MCLIPERDIFIQLLMRNCQDNEDFGEDVIILLSFVLVQPLLEEMNAISVGVLHYQSLHLLNDHFGEGVYLLMQLMVVNLQVKHRLDRLKSS